MMINGNVQRNKDVLSSLMMTQLQRLSKGLVVGAFIAIVPFLLQPDFTGYLIPYEVQLYLNPYYRYGVWIIFFGLVIYCFYDVYFYTSYSRTLTLYQQIPVSPFKQYISWIFSVTCIFSLYFLWQIFLFIIFYQIAVLKNLDLEMANGLYFSVQNALYAKLYIPANFLEGILWMIRMFVYAFLTVFFGRRGKILRKHRILSILFVLLLFCYIGIRFFPVQILYSIPPEMLQHFTWIRYFTQIYYIFMYGCEGVFLLCALLLIFREYRRDKEVQYEKIS